MRLLGETPHVLLFVRFAVIGVNSFIHPEIPESVPDVYAKITPAIKKWIKRIARNAQDSNCQISTVHINH